MSTKAPPAPKDPIREFEKRVLRKRYEWDALNKGYEDQGRVDAARHLARVLLVPGWKPRNLKAYIQGLIRGFKVLEKLIEQ